eukprot:1918185-Prymnesium_polylepis.1
MPPTTQFQQPPSQLMQPPRGTRTPPSLNASWLAPLTLAVLPLNMRSRIPRITAFFWSVEVKLVTVLAATPARSGAVMGCRWTLRRRPRRHHPRRRHYRRPRHRHPRRRRRRRPHRRL